MKLKKDISILSVISLLLLLNFIPYPFKYLIIFGILSFVLNWYVKDTLKSVAVSLVIVILMYMMNYRSYSYEYFEDKKEGEEEVEADAVQNAGETKEKLSGMKLEGERIDEEKNLIQEEGDKQIINEIKKSGKKLPKEEHEKIGNMQKELFENTKQINAKLNGLSPMLQEVKKIREQFLQLGLVK